MKAFQQGSDTQMAGEFENNMDSNDEIRKFQKRKKNEQQAAAQAKKALKRKAEHPGEGEGEAKVKKDWSSVKAEAKLKKEKRKEWKQGGNERYMLCVKSKKLWEELRTSNCKKDRKNELCKELWAMIKGQVRSLIYSHDTVRVIETLVAAGGEEYRTFLFEEMKDAIYEMSINKYSRFFVQKLLRYGSRSQKDFIIQSFRGKTPKMMRNKLACDIVELAYNDFANAKQRSMMVQEFYGPSFRLFPDENIHCLEDALKAKPTEEERIMKDLRESLQPIVDKGIFTNTMVHTLLRDYLTFCPVSDRTAMIETLRENLLPIIHTKDGAQVAMICLWHGMNKDKKVILKSFKSHFLKVATDPQGYKVLLAAFDCVDDTVLLKSLVIKELMTSINELVASDQGFRVLRYIVAPRSPTFFNPTIVAQLTPGDNNAVSKKDQSVRQREIQEYSSEGILGFLDGNVKTWAFNANWTLFIAAALETLSGNYKYTIFNQLAEMCAEPHEQGMQHVLEVAHTSKMINKIIKLDKQQYADNKPTFTEALLKTMEDKLDTWLDSNRGCFMIVCMIETEISKFCKILKRKLSPHQEKISELTTAGGKILYQKLQELEN